MKRKINIQELVTKLQKDNLRKRDLVVPSHCLTMNPAGNLVITDMMNNEALNEVLAASGIASASEKSGMSMELAPLPMFHQQAADKLKIPKTYYDRMLDGHESLLAKNFNHWMDSTAANYLIRCFIDKEEKTGYARALLSDRYKVIDNFDVLMTALEAIKDSGLNIDVLDADLTEQNMFVRFVAPDIIKESPELLKNYRSPKGGNGDFGIMTGFVLSNSEVGAGTFTIAPRLLIRACSNGMTLTDEQLRRVHLGSKMEEGSIQWSEETKQQNLKLIISQVKDAVKTYVSQEWLGKAISRLEEKAGLTLQHPVDAVKNMAYEQSYSEEKTNAILNYFVKSGDMSAFGISQAMTFYAHQDGDAEEQYEMEKDAVLVLDRAPELDKPFISAKFARNK